MPEQPSAASPSHRRWLPTMIARMRHAHPRNQQQASIDMLVTRGRHQATLAQHSLAHGHPHIARIHGHHAVQWFDRAIKLADEQHQPLQPNVYQELAAARALLGSSALEPRPEVALATAEQAAAAGEWACACRAYALLLNDAHLGSKAADELLQIYEQQHNWQALLADVPQAPCTFCLRVADAAFAARAYDQARLLWAHALQTPAGSEATRAALQELLQRGTTAESKVVLRMLLESAPDFSVCLRMCQRAFEAGASDIARRFYQRAELVAASESDWRDLDELSQELCRLLLQRLPKSLGSADIALIDAIKIEQPGLLFDVGLALVGAHRPDVAYRLFVRAAALAPLTRQGCEIVADTAARAGLNDVAAQWHAKAYFPVTSGHASL